MKRREFIAALGSAAAWPVVGRGQQSPIPVVGLLAVGAPSDMYAVSALGRGLSEAGYVEGKNVAIEYCWGENDVNRLAKLATDLVNRRVAVMVAGGAQSALTAKAATQTIPIVFAVGGDPVKLGLVTSLSRPEYNLTGVVFLAQLMESKRLSLLHDMVPQASRIALLLNPKNPSADTQLREVDEATHVFGLELNVQRASTSSEIDQAFPAMVQAGARGLLVAADPFFNSSRAQLIAQAERYKLPAMYEWREFPEAGGLMSYGTRLTEAFRQAGVYVAQILKGAKPADLPVQQLTKFELVINLNTAKALGIEVPPSLSARADEVIE